MIKIIKDDFLNNFYLENGYAKFQLFDSEQVNEIKSFYKKNASNQNVKGLSLHATSNSGDVKLIEKVSTFLMHNYFEPELQKHLVEYELTLSNFIVKEPTKNSVCNAHQDWLLVDEDKYTSFNCWVSLEDANYMTGNLQIIPGSHKFQKSIRAMHTDRFYEKGKKRISDFMVDVPTKAGECVIFNHGVIHASRMNRSNYPRIAIVAGGYSKEADLLFFFRESSSSQYVEKYKINKDILLRMKEGERPKGGQLLEKVQIDVNYLREEEFNQLCFSKVNTSYILRNKFLNFFLGKSN